MNFARFMAYALYDLPYGYYMTQPVELERCSSGRIGWGGDFYTAPELSPVLAKTLIRQILDIDTQLGHPNTFTFMEIGAGNGTFALDFLRECQNSAFELFQRLSYRIVERSPHLQSRQKIKLEEMLGNRAAEHVTWCSSLEEIESHSLTGVIFSNELVDALPVHRIQWKNNRLSEIHVDFRNGHFVECLRPPSSPQLGDYLDTHQISLSDGQTSELHLAAEVWMNEIARILAQGVVLTIDYGHTTNDYYCADRTNGTLLCYYRHTVSTNPYVHVGEQDITAHVNFSVLAHNGRTSGLIPVGLTTLTNWLMGLGVEELVEHQDPESQDVKALAQLLRPHGMGKTFKVLVQQKGMGSFPVQGLRYRAFFDNVFSRDGEE